MRLRKIECQRTLRGVVEKLKQWVRMGVISKEQAKAIILQKSREVEGGRRLREMALHAGLLSECEADLNPKHVNYFYLNPRLRGLVEAALNEETF